MNEPDDNFQAAAKRYLVRAGMPMDFRHNEVNFYYWRDDAAAEHAQACGGWVVSDESIVDENECFDQFEDTMSDPYRVYGMSVNNCACACGLYQNMTLFSEGTVLLLNILESD